MIADYNLFDYAMGRAPERMHPGTSSRTRIWKCRDCGSETPEYQLGVKQYRNRMDGKIYREAACPICGSMSIEPTGRHEK